MVLFMMTKAEYLEALRQRVLRLEAQWAAASQFQRDDMRADLQHARRAYNDALMEV